MAKDGTRRGGRRVRAGDKPKALSDKIAEGKDADIMEFHAPELDAADLDEAADLTGADMPSPSAYLSAQQKNGKPLGADIVYKETWLWLKQRGCEKHVNKRLLESYSQAFARFVQCEEALSTYGLLGKHPTTGGVIASPFVQMSQTFQKQANLLWYEIFDIVKQNCTTKFDGTPQDDMKEDTQFWRDLKANRQKMTKQQYRTLKGQAVSGKVLDARKGLQKVLKRRNGA